MKTPSPETPRTPNSDYRADERRGRTALIAGAGLILLALGGGAVAGNYYGSTHADNQRCLNHLRKGDNLGTFKLPPAELNQITTIGTTELQQDEPRLAQVLQAQGAKLVTIRSFLGDPKALAANQNTLDQANKLQSQMDPLAASTINPTYYSQEQTANSETPGTVVVTVGPFTC